MTSLYFSRNESNVKFNIQNVIKEALASRKTLKLCDRKILSWYQNLPKSTKELLHKACEDHGIEILL